MLEASGIVAFTKTTSERPANRYGDSVIIRMRDPFEDIVFFYDPDDPVSNDDMTEYSDKPGGTAQQSNLRPLCHYM